MIPKEKLESIESEEQLETLVEDTTESTESKGDAEESNMDDDDDSDVCNPCVTCALNVIEDQKCCKCSKRVHFTERCSSTEETQTSCRSGLRVCMICQTKLSTASLRNSAFAALEKQATKMLSNTNKRLDPASVGVSVIVPVPDLDRGRGDHRNLKGVILSEAEGFYKIGTQFGILDSMYSRNQFSTASSLLLEVSAVPDNEITLREAARLSSSGTGQGFFFCRCNKVCAGRCKCKKASRFCNSKCHNSSACKNK